MADIDRSGWRQSSGRIDFAPPICVLLHSTPGAGRTISRVSGAPEDAIPPVADLAKQLGFAPVKLGKLNEGGALVHARGRIWGQLIFQDLFKKEQ
jgi:predicted dinucleotide-binding enzyme